VDRALRMVGVEMSAELQAWFERCAKTIHEELLMTNPDYAVTYERWITEEGLSRNAIPFKFQPTNNSKVDS